MRITLNKRSSAFQFFRLGLYLLFIPLFSVAQNGNLPLHFQISQEVESNLYTNNQIEHSAVKPYVKSIVGHDNYASLYADSNKYYYDFTLKLFKENLLLIDEKDVHLEADPLFNFVYGQSNIGDSTYGLFTNTRGVRVAGDITSKFSFETRFYETQFYFPQYLDSIADARTIAFGMGRSKTFKDVGHDVGFSSGYISYSPSKNVNVQFGQNKHFFGNGYRSLLLSDNSFNYPNLTFTLKMFKGKLLYKNVNAWLQSLQRIPVSSTPESLFKTKGGSFRYLSFKPSSNLELGIFEGTIYKQYDQELGQIPLPTSFYIPIIGASSLMNGFDSDNNLLLGANFSFNVMKDVLLYGQFALDGSSKNGIQLGGKWWNPFGLKKSWWLFEYNQASTYMYTQTEDRILQNYTHTNQELAHPIGASFNEVISMFHFEKERFFANAKLMFASKLRHSGGYGENILLPNDAMLITIAPEEIDLWNYGVEAGYSLNIQTRMQMFLSAYKRSEMSANWRNDEWFWQVGFRTTLNNFYYDL